MADTTSDTLPPRRRRRMPPALERYALAFTTPKGIVALAMIVIVTVGALMAPLIFPGGYDQQSRDSLMGVSLVHPFGTDELGRDLLIRSLYGLRTDLGLIYTAVPVSMAIGTLLGLSGALAGWLGSATQRMLDIIAGFPGLILGICVVIIVGPGWNALFIAITISGLPAFGRLARGILVSQWQRDYVLAAQTLGVPKWKIMVRHILPNAADPIIVQGAVFVVAAVFIEAALSIVGLGLQPPDPSLGILLNQGVRYITRAPAYVIGPTVILLIVALAFGLLADALNDAVKRK
jgi:peptide/nickel transport system permease protein